MLTERAKDDSLGVTTDRDPGRRPDGTRSAIPVIRPPWRAPRLKAIEVAAFTCSYDGPGDDGDTGVS